MPGYIKLPDNLKQWKIVSLISRDEGNEVYKITKKEYDGTVINANLRYVVLSKDLYNGDNINFINAEADFLKKISKSSDCFNYIDVLSNNNPAKEKIELYIITEELQPLSELLKTKSFSEYNIVDFGIQMSSILEKLEANNIFHGNIRTDNIFADSDGKYKIGGFSDFESKITDLSFVAPEISNKKSPDFTTDIYSLGLIMYCMCNDGKLPFENDSQSKNEAIKKRFSENSVPAPNGGSEKLKSVIVIACQPKNENRWKNAGNIKNALTSLKGELVQPAESAENKIIAPASTEFDSNVFEDFEYEEFEEEPNNIEENLNDEDTQADEDNAIDEQNADSEENDNNNALEESSFEIDEVTEIAPDNEEKADNDSDKTINTAESSDKPNDVQVIKSETDEIDDEVFDNFEINRNPVSFKETAKEKDYGDFFDEPEEKPDNKDDNISKSKTEDKIINLEDNKFDDNSVDDFDYEITDDSKKSKKSTVIIIISIIVMLAALGLIAFCIINGLSSNKPQNSETTSPTTTSSTQAETTLPPTTAAPTTQPTTVAENKTVIPVVGYGYSYAKKLLEQDGFVVEIGEYRYSNEYDEGYVIAQSPDGDSEAKKGSVVTLDISLGAEEPETTVQPETEAESNNENSKTDSSYIFANSDSAYLSKSDISSLNKNDLEIALNEIYARRGRIFKDEGLANYFESKTWYTPKYTSDEFSKYVTFNKYEQANLNLMIDEQKSRGYR